MASSSTFPSSHQNTSVSGVFLSRLCTPFCFGYTDCCQHPGMQCWPLAWLIARPCFVLLLQVCCRGRTISRHSWFWGPEACNYWRLNWLAGRDPVQLAENLSVTWPLVSSTGPQPNWLEPSGMQLVQGQVVRKAPGTAGYEAWQHANTTSTPVGGTNPRTDTLEGGLQHDTHQHLYVHGRIWWQNGYL